MDSRAKTARKLHDLPICYKYLLRLPGQRMQEAGLRNVLDFGSGYGQAFEALREVGWDVMGTDLVQRVADKDWHPLDHPAWMNPKRYEVVVLSNVVNVQSRVSELNETLLTAFKCLEERVHLNEFPTVVWNYPDEPRKIDGGWGSEKMMHHVCQRFDHMVRYYGDCVACVKLVMVHKSGWATEYLADGHLGRYDKHMFKRHGSMLTFRTDGKGGVINV